MRPRGHSWREISERGAVLTGSGSRSDRPVLLLVHGGHAADDPRPVPLWWPPVVRMTAMAIALRRAGNSVYLLRNSGRGWSADRPADLAWAAGRLRERLAGAPVIGVGHSLGGRMVVGGVLQGTLSAGIGLATWLPACDAGAHQVVQPGEIVLVHGDHDRDVAVPTGWVSRARHAGLRVLLVVIPGGGHMMVRRWSIWTRLVRRAVETLNAEPGATSDQTRLDALPAPSPSPGRRR